MNGCWEKALDWEREIFWHRSNYWQVRTHLDGSASENNREMNETFVIQLMDIQYYRIWDTMCPINKYLTSVFHIVTKSGWIGSKLFMVKLDGLMQGRCNSIANALELCLSCTNPSIWPKSSLDTVSRITAITFHWVAVESLASVDCSVDEMVWMGAEKRHWIGMEIFWHRSNC